MKRVPKYLLLFIPLLVFTLSCKDDPSASPSQAVLRTRILTAGNGTWSIPSVEGVMLNAGVAAFDITELFQNFTVTFTETGYTTTGTTPVWARSGTWTFTDDSGTKFRRDDNLEVTIIEISANTVKLTLQWDETTYEDGRSKALAGLHTFTFTK